MTTFDHPLGEAHFDTYLPQDVPPALDAAEAAARARLDLVATSAEPLLALGDATAGYEFIVNIADELAAMLGGDWNDVTKAAKRRNAEFVAELYQREDLFAAIRAVEPDGPVEERLRAHLLRRFEHSGAHLDPASQARLTAINARLAELGSDFMTNLQAANAASGVATHHPEGLPDTLIESARAAGVERGIDGYWVPYSDENATIVLRQAENRELREAMYRLTVTRAAESNAPLVTEILALRQELAGLLGYDSYIALTRADAMVADPQALLDQLAEAYRPQADREHRQLLTFARDLTGDDTLQLTAADLDNPMDGFYATKLRESLGLAATGSVCVPVPLARQ